MNVPKLRFKEFNDEWIEKRLSDISTLTSSKRIYLSDYVNSGIPFYRGKEITELKRNLPVSDILYITESKYNEIKSKYGVPIKDDILITGVGTLGNVYRVSNNSPFYFKDGNLIWLKEIKEDSSFLEKNLEYGKKKILDSAIGSTQKALTIVELSKLKFSFPQIKEQLKVANLLSLLDKKIELQTKKIEDLKLFKLCISNIFFNKNVKEKKSTLDNFCELFTAKSKVDVINPNGCYYVMDMGTITSDGYILHSKPTFCESDMLQKGDLVMPKDDIGGGLIIGKTGYINKNEKYILGDHVYLIKTKNINPLFLHYQINSKYINKELKKKVTGSAQLGLKASNITNQEIFIYSDEMQSKISNILRLYDEKIILELAKIEKMRALKKGLMQNMFV